MTFRTSIDSRRLYLRLQSKSKPFRKLATGCDDWRLGCVSLKRGATFLAHAAYDSPDAC